MAARDAGDADDAVLRVQRTVFARFFGIGDDTPASAESSYTQTRMLVSERRAFMLRGFAEGRFADREAWTIEVEQRIRLTRTHIFGVTADWRADPFVAAGQVLDTPATAFERPQVAAGVGLRVFVAPSIVGRVDLATGGEGTKIYVEIGYPY